MSSHHLPPPLPSLFSQSGNRPTTRPCPSRKSFRQRSSRSLFASTTMSRSAVTKRRHWRPIIFDKPIRSHTQVVQRFRGDDHPRCRISHVPPHLPYAARAAAAPLRYQDRRSRCHPHHMPQVGHLSGFEKIISVYFVMKEKKGKKVEEVGIPCADFYHYISIIYITIGINNHYAKETEDLMLSGFAANRGFMEVSFPERLEIEHSAGGSRGCLRLRNVQK